MRFSRGARDAGTCRPPVLGASLVQAWGLLLLDAAAPGRWPGGRRPPARANNCRSRRPWQGKPREDGVGRPSFRGRCLTNTGDECGVSWSHRGRIVAKELRDAYKVRELEFPAAGQAALQEVKQDPPVRIGCRLPRKGVAAGAGTSSPRGGCEPTWHENAGPERRAGGAISQKTSCCIIQRANARRFSRGTLIAALQRTRQERPYTAYSLPNHLH